MAASLPSGLFLISMPRAGSTLLRLILDTHSQIGCPEEVHLGRLAAGLELTIGGLAETSHEHARPLAERASVHGAGRILSDLMSDYLRRKGKSIWCEKTPGNVDHLDLLAAALPDARFLMLHRHCLDVVASCIKLLSYGQTMPMLEPFYRRHHPHYVPALIEAWEDNTSTMLRFEREHPDRCHRLRYEDLVRKPEPTLAALFAFLGLALEPGLLDRVFTTEHHQRPGGGDFRALHSTRISDDSIGLGAKLPRHAYQPTPALLRERMNTRLEQLGYPRVVFGAEGLETGLEQAAPAPVVTVKSFFEKTLAPKLRTLGDVPAGLDRPLRFVVDGPRGGVWVLDLGRRPARLIPGGEEGAEIRVALADFEDLLAERLPAATFFSRLRLDPGLDPASVQALWGRLV